MAPDPPSKTPRFAHQPLDESEDCIRLIEISPITPKSLEIQCIIKHVRLSERPQYEALSYMWGDSSKTMDILIDGKVFGVTVNLRDGLWYLRQRANGSSMKFWVDAICINQGDMNEKIRQIRIMRQIYSQAQTVVAWLGGRWTLPIRRREDKSLCAFNESLAGKVEVVVDGSVNTSYRLKIEKWTPLKIRWLKSKSPGSVIPRDYLHLPEGFPKKRPTRPDGLYHDKYWERVWIVQELGNAAKVEVAYISRNVLQPGNEWRLCACTFSWEEFLKTIWDDRTEGPIRLDRQLREKPEGGFALSDLLLAHVGAKCQLTHDKVYGLLGLAVDSEGFPIDYEKSLFEVWKDTVRFINPTDHESTVRLAARCWRVLGDSHVEESAAELSRSIETPAAPTEQTDGTESETFDCFHLNFSVIGMVTSVGPDPSDFIKDPRAAEVWDLNIRRNRTDKEIHRLVQETDELMKSLSSLESSDFSSFVAPLPFTHPFDFKLHDGNLMNSIIKSSTRFSLPPMSWEAKGSVWESRLYRVDGLRMNDKDCQLGVTVADVQRGDLLCEITRADKRFLLRREAEGEGVRIVGTAWLPHEAAWKARLKAERYKGKGTKPGPGEEAYLRVCVGADALYALICPVMIKFLRQEVWKGRGER